MNASKSSSESVLVVDDVPLNLEVIVDYLIEAGYETYVATSGEETLEQLELVKPDLILLDVMLPGINGFETCRQIKRNDATKDIPIIFMTALAEVSDKVIGFQAGGVDYVTKPIQREEIMARVNTHLSMRKVQKQLHDANENLEKRVSERTAQLNSALKKVEQLKTKLQAENSYLQEEIKAELNFNEIIGKSESIKNVLKDIQEVAPTDTTVLILGETGTGKEVIARALHTASHRNTKSFIKVNCAAIPDNLVESEFFGHEKGAFTGASAKRDGRFTLADNGTIFLDEIGELPLDLQSKLLRVLQEGEFDPVGSS
ncbi:MAG: sigma 54-interacting transcriptional regulator, partial [Gammaproteobacteria bacterium]